MLFGSLVWLVCLLTNGCQQKPDELKFRLINSSGFQRELEVVTINVSELQLSKNIEVFTSAGDKIPFQCIDADKDGTYEQVLLAVNMNGEEELVVQVVPSDTCKSTGEDTNTITFSLKKEGAYTGLEIRAMDRKRGVVQTANAPYFHLEGPGIENDKVAFRTFFDPRNGKDIYGKLTDKAVLTRAGIDSSWHVLSDWGMDILRVGKSLGAGGLAVLADGQLHRLGDADRSSYQELYSGPLQASHRIDFTGWDAGAKKINGYEKLTLTKGNYYYHNEIGLSDTTLKLVVGMPNFKCDSLTYTQHHNGLASVWSYGPQADGTDSQLGMAIMFYDDLYLRHDAIKDGEAIANTSYVVLRSKALNNIWFFACWEMSDEYFSTQENFEKYLQQEAERLSNKIEIIPI